MGTCVLLILVVCIVNLYSKGLEIDGGREGKMGIILFIIGYKL